MQNWLFKKTTRVERWLLIVAGLALVYPKALLDYIGVALLAVVVVSQTVTEEGRAANAAIDAGAGPGGRAT